MDDRDIPLVLLAYGLYKYIRGTKIIPLTEVPVHQALEEARNDPENVPIKPAKGWKRLNVLWA